MKLSKSERERLINNEAEFDAYLNSVRADSLESFAHQQRVIADAMPDAAFQRHRRFAAGLAEDFAAQLRAGKDGE